MITISFKLIAAGNRKKAISYCYSISIVQKDASNINIGLSNKSKASQALWLFENGKRPIEIAIELDISYNEVIDLQQEYWALTELYDLPLMYQELKHDFDSFSKLFKILKRFRV